MEIKYNNFINDQFTALKLLYDKRLFTPFLSLLYSTIDIFGFLSDIKDSQKTNIRFQNFAQKYMSKYLQNALPADLWGARCGITHANQPESDWSKNNRARQILYSWGTVNPLLPEQAIKRNGKQDKYVAVNIENLHNSLMQGIIDFNKTLETDKYLHKSCMEKVNKFYCSINISTNI